MAQLDNRSYYDDFAASYERGRDRGYHRMIDDLEVALVEEFGTGGRVLEAGCGTGLILERVARFASFAAGVDLSRGMLERARQRGLQVSQGSVTALPHADSSFDVVYSFKVLPHIAEIRAALAEMARVVRPGGIVLAEFYNPLSLRYLIKRWKSPTRISECATDEAVFTRYDTVRRARTYLPDDLEWLGARGVRIVTPVSHALRVPGVGVALRQAEEALARVPALAHLAGFAVVIARKRA